MVLQAYYRGSLDNISVIVVKFSYGGTGREEREKKSDKQIKKSADGRGEDARSKKVADVAEEKVFVGGKVVGVGRVVEYEDEGVVFKERDPSTLVDTTISEKLVEAEMARVMAGDGKVVGSLKDPTNTKCCGVLELPSATNPQECPKEGVSLKEHQASKEGGDENTIYLPPLKQAAGDRIVKVNVETMNWEDHGQKKDEGLCQSHLRKDLCRGGDGNGGELGGARGGGKSGVGSSISGVDVGE